MVRLLTVPLGFHCSFQTLLHSDDLKKQWCHMCQCVFCKENCCKYFCLNIVNDISLLPSHMGERAVLCIAGSFYWSYYVTWKHQVSHFFFKEDSFKVRKSIFTLTFLSLIRKQPQSLLIRCQKQSHCSPVETIKSVGEGWRWWEWEWNCSWLRTTDLTLWVKSFMQMWVISAIFS